MFYKVLSLSEMFRGIPWGSRMFYNLPYASITFHRVLCLVFWIWSFTILSYLILSHVSDLLLASWVLVLGWLQISKRLSSCATTPTRLDGIVDIFHHQVSTTRIVPSAASVLLVEDGLVLFKALCIGVVNILGKGHKRRRSVGNRHFMWKMGRWFKGQQLTLLLSAHDRHALLWSSLPLPQSPSVYQLDKPRIFSIHSIPTSFGVWTIFIFHLTHPCSIFVTLCHPTHPYLLLPHLIFHNSESAYSFYSYLPLCLLLG